MTSDDWQTELEREETKQTAGMLSRLMGATWGLLLFIIFTGVFYKDWTLVRLTLMGFVIQIIPFFLVRRGNLRAGSMLVVLSALFIVTFIATLGQGIHDLALVAYPIIFIFAGMTLNRLFFRLCVGLALAGLGWLFVGEAMGWFVPVPLAGQNPNWVNFATVVLFILVAALAVDSLTTNMRKNLNQARQENVQRKQTEEALTEKEVQYRALADSGKALIWTSGMDKLCNYFNQPWLNFTGRRLEQELGNGWAEGVHPDDFQRCLDVYVAAFDQREAFDMEYRLRHNTGEYRWIQDLGTPNYNSNNEFIGYIGHCFDITEHKHLEEQLRYQGSHDAMTGIYNRTYFEDELARFERSREYPISIVIADLDGLKITNDSLGHAVGDDLIRSAANILGSVFRAGDILARIGGDEFGALLPSTDSETAGQIVGRIRERLAEHRLIYPEPAVELSLGYATSEDKNLFKAFTIADQRMYVEKAARKEVK
ncbi:MAG: diguanylate cyclase [Chloroflexota bacterium]